MAKQNTRISLWQIMTFSVDLLPFSACLTCSSVGGSENGDSCAWGHHAPAADGKDFDHDVSWSEAHWDLSVGAVDGASLAYGGGGAAADVWDGEIKDHDVAAGRQGGKASSPATVAEFILK